MMFRALFCLVLLLSCTTVSAALQSLTSIEQAVHRFVAASVAMGSDVEFSTGRLDPRLRLPQCTQPLDVRNTRATRQSGSMSVEVRCNATKAWVLYVPVEVVRYAEVAVATRTIAREQAITADDVTLARRRVDAHRPGYLADPARAVGQIAARPIAAGAVISHTQLKAPRMIRRGDQVVLSIGTSAVTVRAKGQALQDGVVGERITVLNLSSERVIQGVVSKAGEVVVHAGTML